MDENCATGIPAKEMISTLVLIFFSFVTNCFFFVERDGKKFLFQSLFEIVSLSRPTFFTNPHKINLTIKLSSSPTKKDKAAR